MIILKNKTLISALMLVGLAACGESEAPAQKSSIETSATAESQSPAAPPAAPEVKEVAENPVAETIEVVEPKSHTVFAGATSFSPIVLFTNPGDEICWVNMTAHDSQSIDGLIPDGAEPWHIALGRNGCVTLPVEGAYIYKCNPHYPVGMAGAIVVGAASNIAQIEANVSGRAKGVVIKVKRALAEK